MGKQPIKLETSEVDVVICDVDGVLTDGGMYWSADGLLFKKFHTRDAGGYFRLTANHIRVVFVTGSADSLTENRLRHIGATEIYMNIQDKGAWMESFIKENSLNTDRIVYVADDYNDLPALIQCGFTICPIDACDGVIALADIICDRLGGEGVLGEVADLILDYEKEINRVIANRRGIKTKVIKADFNGGRNKNV